MDHYTGEIIEESLKDPILVQSLPVTTTRVEQVTSRHQTPWLKQWTLHTLRIPSTQATSVAEQLSHEIETTHQAWYIDFKNDTTHYIVFPGRVFRIDRTKPAQYQEAREYGISLGIPAHQLIDTSGIALPTA